MLLKALSLLRLGRVFLIRKLTLKDKLKKEFKEASLVNVAGTKRTSISLHYTLVKSL